MARVLLYLIGLDVMTLAVYGRVRYVSSRQNVGLSDGYFLCTKHVGTVAHCEWSGFASQMLHKAIPSHHRRARYSHGRWSALGFRFFEQTDGKARADVSDYAMSIDVFVI